MTAPEQPDMPAGRDDVSMAAEIKWAELAGEYLARAVAAEAEIERLGKAADGWKANCQAQLEETHRNIVAREAAERRFVELRRDYEIALVKLHAYREARCDNNEQFEAEALSSLDKGKTNG